MPEPWKPTPDQVQLSQNRTVPDVIGPDLRVLFCGINPSLYSAAVGHHFARPGNRFWPAMKASGFTSRLYSPFEDQLLPAFGYGITNVVDRATASASEVSVEEFVEGGRLLAAKIERVQPIFVAFLGITAFRAAFRCPEATVGLQTQRISGASFWVLPNPSGLNAHYRLADLARLFGLLRAASEVRGDRPPA